MRTRTRGPAASAERRTAPATADRAPANALLAALLAALPALALYLRTLHPGLPAGDSGELITVAATGGVAHPPGYPLYTMLAGAFLRLLPAGSLAWRANLFSAVCMAAAAGVLAAAAARAARSTAAGVLAALLFATATVAWRYALVAEVFALHALLAAGVLFALTLRPARAVGALAFAGALALSHHHTLLLLALPAWLVTFARASAAAAAAERARMRARLLGVSVWAALAGLAPLLWIPFAARHRDALVWGDATTWHGFLSLLTRAEYGTFQLDAAGLGARGSGAAQVLAFVRALPHVFGWPALVLALAGAVALARQQRALALVLAGYAVLQLWFFTRIGFPTDQAVLRGVVERFYILPLVALAFAAGAGVAWLGSRVRGAGARLTALTALLALLVLALAPRARGISERGNMLTASYGRALLASLPPRAVLFTRGDVQHNALAYLTRVERLRPDVTLVDQELMTYPWYVRRVRAREPGLLPPFTRAERVTLADGATLEGLVLPRAGGEADLLVASDLSALRAARRGEEAGPGVTALLLRQGVGTVPASAVARVVPAPSESLYAATRRGFRTAAFLEQGDDRYSGFPGSRNLLWVDQLFGSRPVLMTGSKEDSYRLRYDAFRIGRSDWIRPRHSPPGPDTLLAVALDVVAAADSGVYFRDHPATSFESALRAAFADDVAVAALLLCQPFAPRVAAAHPLGHARALAFARRFEPLEPSPDPHVLRAIGLLRAFDPAFRDLALARRDLERALAMSRDPAPDRDVQAVLRAIAEGGFRDGK